MISVVAVHGDDVEGLREFRYLHIAVADNELIIPGVAALFDDRADSFGRFAVLRTTGPLPPVLAEDVAQDNALESRGGLDERPKRSAVEYPDFQIGLGLKLPSYAVQHIVHGGVAGSSSIPRGLDTL